MGTQAIPSVNAVSQGEDTNSQVQQMLNERLTAQREAAASMSDQLQRIAAENLSESRSPQQQGPQAAGQGDRSAGEVKKRLEDFVQRFGQIVEKNSAFNIRIGLGVTDRGDPLIRIIDKKSQETVETIPTPQAIKLADNMELFTSYFVQKFSEPGPANLIAPGSLVNKIG